MSKFKDNIKIMTQIIHTHIAQRRALSSLRDPDANSGVGENPVMGDVIAAVNKLVCNVLYM